MDRVRDIGSRLELLVDDWLIEEMDGAALRLHQPVPREVVLQFDRPWESPVSSCSTVMLDEGRYRMWYRAGADADQRVAYAESEDGVRWERVTTGLVEFDGSRENNILLDGSVAKQMAVFKDANPSTTDEQRYKAISRIRHIDGERDAIRGHYSTDGIAWETFDRDPLLVAPDDGTRPIFDSHNVAFWDGLTGTVRDVHEELDTGPGLVPGRRVPVDSPQYLGGLPALGGSKADRPGRLKPGASIHERMRPVLPRPPLLHDVPATIRP